MSPAISVIILAAGSSSRLGKPKQLLKTKNVPLLINTIQAALDANLKTVVVVLGSNYDTHQALISHLPVDIIHHTNWQNGMGSSLKCGVKHVMKNYPETNAILVTVCDQPHLNAAHLQKLCAAYPQGELVASCYNQSAGVPALFDKSFFNEILNLGDAQGAKSVIQKNLGKATLLDWPDGAIDIDTAEDLKHLED